MASRLSRRQLLLIAGATAGGLVAVSRDDGGQQQPVVPIGGGDDGGAAGVSINPILAGQTVTIPNGKTVSIAAPWTIEGKAVIKGKAEVA